MSARTPKTEPQPSTWFPKIVTGSNLISRRDLIRILGASTVAAGFGLVTSSHAHAEDDKEELVWSDDGGFQGRVIRPQVTQSTEACATLADGKIIQPRRELPLLHQTDVLVVGGGTAGVSAAVAARRAGAEVTLVERYGCLGGLWTGGLVLIVGGQWGQGSKQVCKKA